MIIVGAGGQLGTAFRRLRSEATALVRTDLDLRDSDRIIPVLGKLRPDSIVNCAAFTAVDLAEQQEVEAYAVNAAAVGEMARYASEAGIPFVTFSTDYVFAGTSTKPYVESDRTAPINAYGRTKRAGELLALQVYPECLIIRTSWVISGSHPNFVATMLRLAEDGEVHVVDDQHGCPTIAGDLARGAIEALDVGATGILHLVNEGPTTWYELARESFRLAGFDPSQVVPVSSDEFPRPAPRPGYSVLGSERLGSLGMGSLPPWRESLPALVEELT